VIDLQAVDCDVLVIEWETAGCFIALRLGQKGLKVYLADTGSLFRETSGRSDGGVRQPLKRHLLPK
jgi:glycerol-3-phosphate dehydrogenase